MPKARIIGVGSPLADDTLGLRAIDVIERSGLIRRYPPGWIELEQLDRPGPVLAEYLRDVELAILIDAMSSGAGPGSVKELNPANLDALVKPISSHGFDLGATLRLAHALGALPKRLHILGIEMAAIPDGNPATIGEVRDEQFRRPLLNLLENLLNALTPDKPTRLEV